MAKVSQGNGGKMTSEEKIEICSMMIRSSVIQWTPTIIMLIIWVIILYHLIKLFN